MLSYSIILLFIGLPLAHFYSNRLYTIVRRGAKSEFQCDSYNSRSLTNLQKNLLNVNDWRYNDSKFVGNVSARPLKTIIQKHRDPVAVFEGAIQHILYGITPGDYKSQKKKGPPVYKEHSVDVLAHIPSGAKLRAEMFHNKSGVNLIFSEYLHRGHAYLKITRDHMQTAVDAFAIFLAGSIEDIMRLPPNYVLQSARTIAMMRIAREKLATTWLVVKGSLPADQVTFETLEKFRPLFKYVNAKEMASLNLMDTKILSYLGTHPDLTRYQVGVIANRYLAINKNWSQARYLNVMNNLVCGVPLIYMRVVPKYTFLQLTHQLFYHIRACDPLQRKFYLQMMMRSQALGKSYSWSARDVSRLGLLLVEVDPQSFSAINPEAMSGITSQVMMHMPTEVLLAVTDMQLRYMDAKCVNILAKKINAYRNQKGRDDEDGNMSAKLHSFSTAMLFILLRVVINVV